MVRSVAGYFCNRAAISCSPRRRGTACVGTTTRSQAGLDAVANTPCDSKALSYSRYSRYWLVCNARQGLVGPVSRHGSDSALHRLGSCLIVGGSQASFARNVDHHDDLQTRKCRWP